MPYINTEQPLLPPFFLANFHWRFAREVLGKSSKNTKSRGKGFDLDFLGGGGYIR
jgi:hypothetical protein